MEMFAIIATGIVVPEAIDAGKLLAEQGISARIINMATLLYRQKDVEQMRG